MAVSTATYACEFGSLITAEGTLIEVVTELAAGADSKAPLQNWENLITFTDPTIHSQCTAVWKHSNHPADWAT